MMLMKITVLQIFLEARTMVLPGESSICSLNKSDDHITHLVIATTTGGEWSSVIPVAAQTHQEMVKPHSYRGYWQWQTTDGSCKDTYPHGRRHGRLRLQPEGVTQDLPSECNVMACLFSERECAWELQHVSSNPKCACSLMFTPYT